MRLFESFGATCATAADGATALRLVEASMWPRGQGCANETVPGRGSGEGVSPSGPPKVAGEAEGEGNEQVAAEPFDMVFMDNYMPVMTGFEACRAMRSLGFSRPIYGNMFCRYKNMF